MHESIIIMPFFSFFAVNLGRGGVRSEVSLSVQHIFLNYFFNTIIIFMLLAMLISSYDAVGELSSKLDIHMQTEV